MSSNLAVLPGDTGSPGLMEGTADTGSAERRAGGEPRAGQAAAGVRRGHCQGARAVQPAGRTLGIPLTLAVCPFRQLLILVFWFFFRHSVYASDTDYFILTNLFSQSALTESLLKLNYNQIITSKDTLIT